MTSTRRLLWAVLAGLVLAGAPAMARAAQPTADEYLTARKAFNEGLDLAEAGNWSGALAKFSAADALLRTPLTRLELGRAQMKLGKLVEAQVALKSVKDIVIDPADAGRYDPARREAAELASQLTVRIPSITVVIENAPAGEAPVVTIDDARVPFAALTEPRSVNPGTHRIVARATGVPDQNVDITVVEAENKEAKLVFPPVSPPAASATPVPGPTAVPPRSDVEVDTLPSSSPTLTYVGLGVAGLGLVVGTVTGVMTLGKASTVKDTCPSKRCPDDAPLSSARTLGTVSTVSFAVAGAGLVLGVVGLLTEGKTEVAGQGREHARPGRVSPWIGWQSAGLSGSF